MKAQEADNERDSRGCDRMAELIKTLCGSEGGSFDCRSLMQRMMGSMKEETKEEKRTS